MKTKEMKNIELKIEKIKTKLFKLEIFRPGSITQQYKKPKEKIGSFYQLNYMYKMKSRSEYVRPELLKKIKKQNSDYKIFKKLIEQWIDLGIQHSKIEIAELIQQKNLKVK